jgi:hypothetical protein
LGLCGSSPRREAIPLPQNCGTFELSTREPWGLRHLIRPFGPPSPQGEGSKRKNEEILPILAGQDFVNFRYSYNSNQLIKDFTQQIDGLNISYKSESIESLTVTKYVFWNKGNETINYSDFPSTSKLKIKIKKDFKILDSNIIFTKNDINNVKCELINNEEVLLMFDYLDKGEGFVVQLIHTSPNNKDLYVDGTIKGIGDISKRIIHFEPAYIRFLDKRLSKTGNDRRKAQIALKVMGWLTIFLGIVFLIYSVMVLIKGNMKSVDIIMSFVCSILYFIIGIPFVRSSVPIYFKNFYERIR